VLSRRLCSHNASYAATHDAVCSLTDALSPLPVHAVVVAIVLPIVCSERQTNFDAFSVHMDNRAERVSRAGQKRIARKIARAQLETGLVIDGHQNGALTDILQDANEQRLRTMPLEAQRPNTTVLWLERSVTELVTRKSPPQRGLGTGRITIQFEDHVPPQNARSM
jgi:hypothetical protein